MRVACYFLVTIQFPGVPVYRIFTVTYYLFVFSQKWIKENVTWHGNGTMSYQTRKEFKFIPELSSGNQETDIINTANVPAISAFHQVNIIHNFFRPALFIIAEIHQPLLP